MDAGGARDFRADIEGLRAIAVILVVAFHADLAFSTGGFIGVDVFFVLSGFLITRLLLEERVRTGTISLLGFWSRRARRLIPAACLTLVATLVVAQFVLPPLQRRAVIVDGFFSAVFLANVRFAETLGDYFGSQLAASYPSPLLHYWSLAVEEQFYLVWPVIVLVATRFGNRPRRTLAIVAAVVAIVSFAIAVQWTTQRPESAFFLLPPRMCELLAGALLAIAGPAVLGSVPAAVRAALGWLGLFGIAVAAVTYSETTAFPGYAVLLPVLSTVALLVAGSRPTAGHSPQRLLELRPLQWIGGMSYALYLWHWPVLVLFQAHNPSGSLAQRLIAVAVSVALAQLSMKFVENPVRFAQSLVAPARRGLALGLGLTAFSLGVVGVTWATQPAFDSGELATEVTLDSIASAPTGSGDAVPDPDRTESSATTLDASGNSRLAALQADMQTILEDAAATTNVPSNLRPSLVDAARDTAQVYFDRCISLGDTSEVLDCRYGAQGSATKIVLFGDSHAAQWFPAMESIATAHDAELVVILKGGCPVADVPSTRADLVASCPSWRRAAIATVLDLQPAMVITSSLSGYTTDEERWRSGFTDVLSQLHPATERVVVILDTPRHAGAPPVCLSDNLRTADACVAPRADAVQFTRADTERAVAAAVNAEVIDPTPWLCSPTECPVIVGDALMYRDIDHLTTVASRMLEPLVEAALFP